MSPQFSCQWYHDGKDVDGVARLVSLGEIKVNRWNIKIPLNDEPTEKIIGAAISAHRIPGPGFLESVPPLACKRVCDVLRQIDWLSRDSQELLRMRLHLEQASAGDTKARPAWS